MKQVMFMGVLLNDWTPEEESGYTPITTFYLDFSIADKFGTKAIKDTYNRSFKGWKNDYKYITELVLVLNHKCWEHYYSNNMAFSSLYSELYYQLHDWACDHLKGEEFEYYYNTTD